MGAYTVSWTCVPSWRVVSATFRTSLLETILLTFMLCDFIVQASFASKCGTVRQVPNSNDNGIMLAYTPMHATSGGVSRFWFKDAIKVFDAISNANPKGYTEEFLNGEYVLVIKAGTSDIHGKYRVKCGANSQTNSVQIGISTLETEHCGTLKVIKNDISVGEKFQLLFTKHEQSGSMFQWQKQEGSDYREFTFGGRHVENTNSEPHFVLKVYSSLSTDMGNYRVLCYNGLTSNTVELRLVLVPPSTPVFDELKDFPGCTKCLKVIPGKSMRVICTTSNGTRTVNLLMYKNTQNVSVDLFRGFDYTMATYIFHPTSADVNTEFKCAAKNDAIVTPVEANARVYLFHAPSAPVIGSTEGREGFPISVKCVTTGGKPAPNMKFVFYEHWVNFPVTSVMTPEDGTFRTESVFTAQVTRNDSRKDLMCCTEHDAVSGKLLCKNKTLDVAFPPTAVSVRSQGQVSDDLGNTMLNLTCEVEESNPKSTVNWKGLKGIRRKPIARYNDKGPLGWRYIHELAIELSRENNGRTITCEGVNEKFPDLQLADSFVVNITYSPVISIVPGTSLKVYEGDDVTITCNVDSNPESSVDWISKTGMVIDTVKEVPNEASLRLVNVTLDNPTVYACAAHNGIGAGTVGNVSLVVLDSSKKPLPYVSDEDSSNTGAVVAGIIVTVVVIASIIMVVVVVRKKRSNRIEKNGRTNGSLRIAVEERKPSVQPPGPVYSNVAMSREEGTEEPAEYASVVPKDQRPKKDNSTPSHDPEVHDKRPEANQELVYADLDLERPCDTNPNVTRKASTNSATEYVTIDFNKTGPEYTDSG